MTSILSDFITNLEYSDIIFSGNPGHPDTERFRLLKSVSNHSRAAGKMGIKNHAAPGILLSYEPESSTAS